MQSVINAMSLLLVCGRCELLFQFHTSLKFSNSNDTWLSFELETVSLSLCICFSLILFFSCLSGQRHKDITADIFSGTFPCSGERSLAWIVISSLLMIIVVDGEDDLLLLEEQVVISPFP